ncbi:MAG: cellulase family glycosylhydrolase [Patescibacteria group bacterium]|nr:cellulase family glycosylhydrolase [Patescibacteria group bacterium]
MKKRKKLILKIVIFVIVILALALYVLSLYTFNPNKKIVYGVTFSEEYASQIGLDWKQTFTALLDDLKIRYIRIPTYWDNIHPEENIYNFNDVDWQVNEAAKRDAHIVLIVGRRQPRWPECHDPAWVSGLNDATAHDKVMTDIKAVVNRYKNNKAIEIWQVENEPFLDFFGECPKMSKKEVAEEVALVKSLDTRRILLTDSGELSSWYPLIKMSDLFGTTLYRTTWNKLIGYWHYFFITPSFYRVKAFLWGKPQEAVYVAELQAEPWIVNDLVTTPLTEQFKTMNAKILVQNADFANKTNFYRAYFWGAEWWYWLKTAKNDNSVWEAARKYFK